MASPGFARIPLLHHNHNINIIQRRRDGNCWVGGGVIANYPWKNNSLKIIDIQLLGIPNATENESFEKYLNDVNWEPSYCNHLLVCLLLTELRCFYPDCGADENRKAAGGGWWVFTVFTMFTVYLQFTQHRPHHWPAFTEHNSHRSPDNIADIVHCNTVQLSLVLLMREPQLRQIISRQSFSV